MRFIKTKTGQDIWFEIIHQKIWIHFKNQTSVFQISNQKEHATTDKEPSLSDNDIRSPIPGKVISVQVQAEDKVQKSSLLIVIEAMKMEHSLLAPRNLKVKSVFVKQGDFVENDQKLLLFE